VKFCALGADPELQDQCQMILEEVSPENWEFITSEAQTEPPDAEVYIWNFHPESFPGRLCAEVVSRSLFVVEPRLLDQLRAALGAVRASIVLKPVQGVTLRPFIEHSIRQHRTLAGKSSASERPPSSEERDDLLESLLYANLKLQEYDQSRTNFLARAVHDFRAPLTAVGGYCGLLMEQRLGPMSAAQLELIRRMQHSVQRLSRLTDAMFDLSAGRRAKRELDIQEADIEASISQALHEIAPYAQEKQIQVGASVEPPAQAFLFDAGKIEQALINLLENACKFNPKRGTIDVSAYPVLWREESGRDSGNRAHMVEPALRNGVSNGYRIDIRDSGCGIPDAHIDSIFEEYTSYGGGKDRSSGGLGLAICRMIIDAHRGAIWAESGPTGTQFSIVLPYRGGVSSGRIVRKPAPIVETKRVSA
jgi:signal transduction histidine kinase